jgi:hypothetical protein
MFTRLRPHEALGLGPEKPIRLGIVLLQGLV